METSRQNKRMTVMQRGGPTGVTVVITESPDGTSPRWTVSYYLTVRYGRGPLVFSDNSDTASIPEEFGDVLKWARRRWDMYWDEHKAA